MWKKEVKLHAIHNQKRKATQVQRDLARQRPLPIRPSISESSTSAFLRDKNGYILAVSFSYLSSNPLASSHFEESLPWGIRLNPRLGALQLSQLKQFLP
ncbi:hypothetical protein QL285_062186 [Trifolium repens]|nr:hypothetical protein QL285_062186 [Trifolium repens]